jgi:Mycothiol maleylpyruvate isomerase N-terminal domain
MIGFQKVAKTDTAPTPSEHDPDRSTTMSLARDERRDLTDFLATLTPEQWDAPTLCTRWRVRDVVAHI